MKKLTFGDFPPDPQRYTKILQHHKCDECKKPLRKIPNSEKYRICLEHGIKAIRVGTIAF